MPRPTRAVETRGRDDGLRGLRLTALALLIAFGVIITVITLWPGPPDPDGQRALQSFLLKAYTHGLPTWISFGAVEFAANVVMFVPIGLFGALALPRRTWLVLPLSILASSAIELFQAARLAERHGTPRDVLANACGALIGYLFALLVLRFARRRHRNRSPNIFDPAASPAGPAPVDG